MYYVWRLAPPPFMHVGSEYEYKFREFQIYVGIFGIEALDIPKNEYKCKSELRYINHGQLLAMNL